MPKRIFSAVVTTLFLFTLAIAQDKKPDPKPAPPPPISDSAQVKVLKAQRAVKDAEAEMSQLNARWQTIQQQAQALQQQAPQISKKVTDAQAALKSEIDSVAKDAGLDPTKFDFNPDTLIFVPKASPAPSSPSPEKK